MDIQTDRLRLRSWRESDRNSFAALNADPVVMADQGRPLSRDLSDAKFDRYVAAYKENGFGRWLIETFAGRFLGYCGVMPVSENHPLGPHYEIGWRLLHDVWGHGYATEAAHACLEDAFRRAKLREVLAYTAPDNMRSQAVMERLGLIRDESRDFTVYSSRTGMWRGLVWSATPRLFGLGKEDAN